MRHVFKKLIVTAIAAMSLSACAGLLPSMPNGFMPGQPSSQNSNNNNNNSSNNGKKSNSGDDYDGPYSLQLSNSNVSTQVGKEVRIDVIAYNSSNQRIAIDYLTIGEGMINVSRIDVSNDYFTFTVAAPCENSPMSVTANLKGGKYTAFAKLYVTAKSNIKIVLSDSSTVNVRRDEMHRTIIEAQNVDTGERLDITNYECWFNMLTTNVDYYADIFRDYENKCFYAYYRIYQAQTCRFSFVVTDSKTGANYENYLTVSASGDYPNAYLNWNWNQEPVVGQSWKLNVSLNARDGRNQKIQDVFVYSENTDVMGSVKLQNVNTESVINVAMNPKQEGWTRLAIEVKAANGEQFYELLGINVRHKDSFNISVDFVNNTHDGDYIHYGDICTLTIKCWSCLDGSQVSIQSIDLTETLTQYPEDTTGLKIIDITCNYEQATVTFSVSNKYPNEYVDIFGFIVSTKGRQENFGFGWPIYERMN